MLKKSSFVNTYFVFQLFHESHSAVVNTGDPILGATGLCCEGKYIHKQIMNDKISVNDNKKCEKVVLSVKDCGLRGS